MLGAGYTVFSEIEVTLLPLPDPNGYDLLLPCGLDESERERLDRIWDRLKALGVERADELGMSGAVVFPQLTTEGLPVDFLRETIEPFYGKMDRALESFEFDAVMPVEFHSDFFREVSERIRGFRSLTSSMVSRGDVARRMGDAREAVRWYVNAIRTGLHTCRGGLLIHVLVGTALANSGVTSLFDHREVWKDSEEDLRALVSALEGFDEHYEEVDVVVERDFAFGWNTATIGMRLEWCWREWVPGGSGWFRGENEYAIERGQRARAQLRRLILEVALEAYRRDHKGHPETTDTLVPAYLVRLPVCPVTGDDFPYSLQGDSYELYTEFAFATEPRSPIDVLLESAPAN